MKNLNDLGVQEMTLNESIETSGGDTWVGRTWRNTVDALESAYEWTKETLGVDVEIGRVER